MFYIIGRILNPGPLYWIAWWCGVAWRAALLFVRVYEAGKHEKVP